MNRLAPSRLFHRLRHTRIENKGLKALSLLLAILLFAVSRQPAADLRMVGVPIEYRGLSQGVEIGRDVEQTVSVRLSGPRNIVRSLLPNQILVVADLSNKEPGERIVQLKADESSLPDNVKILQIEPVSIRIKLEPTATKRVKVETRFSGQILEGLEIYRVKLAPGEVEIEGPQSLVNKIDRVVTETVNLDGRQANFQTSVEIEVPQDSLRVNTPGPINLSVDIGAARTLRRFANIPVQWLDKDANGRLLTKTVDVEVFGPKSAIEALRSDDLRVEVKTTGLPPDVNSVAPVIQFPANAEKNIEVRNVIPKEVKVKR
ncbi:MAG: CdaR family protein [Blastocatellia bacterium]